MFGPDGNFHCPHPAAPTGRADPVDGGYRLQGRWPYASGSPYSTWALLGALAFPAGGEGPPRMVTVAVPREQYTVLDDWGDGRVIGMNSSGSNTIVVDDVFVPEHHMIDFNMYTPPTPSVGFQLHRNPMYLWRIAGPYHASLVAPVVGAARAALDEFRDLAATKPTTFLPLVPRYQFHEDQRAFGLATAKADAAEAILYAFAGQYRDAVHRWAQTGEELTVDQDAR